MRAFIRIGVELDEAILNRRSCRSYDQTKHVTMEEIRVILHYGTWSPSGTNGQPWRFTVLRSDAKEEFINLHRADLESRKAMMTEQVQNIAFWSCTSLEKSEVVVLVWDKEKSWASPQSVGACIQTMMLKAHGMGIGSLWVAAVTFSKNAIMNRYNHSDWSLIAGVGFGYPSEKMIGKKGPPRLPVDEVAEFLGK